MPLTLIQLYHALMGVECRAVALIASTEELIDSRTCARAEVKWKRPIVTKVAHTPEEARKLREVGFEKFDDFNGVHLYSKRK